jgi:hypothetical protein
VRCSAANSSLLLLLLLIAATATATATALLSLSLSLSTCFPTRPLTLPPPLPHTHPPARSKTRYLDSRLSLYSTILCSLRLLPPIIAKLTASRSCSSFLLGAPPVEPSSLLNETDDGFPSASDFFSFPPEHSFPPKSISPSRHQFVSRRFFNPILQPPSIRFFAILRRRHHHHLYQTHTHAHTSAIESRSCAPPFVFNQLVINRARIQASLSPN